MKTAYQFHRKAPTSCPKRESSSFQIQPFMVCGSRGSLSFHGEAFSHSVDSLEFDNDLPKTLLRAILRMRKFSKAPGSSVLTKCRTPQLTRREHLGFQLESSRAFVRTSGHWKIFSLVSCPSDITRRVMIAQGVQPGTCSEARHQMLEKPLTSQAR